MSKKPNGRSKKRTVEETHSPYSLSSDQVMDASVHQERPVKARHETIEVLPLAAPEEQKSIDIEPNHITSTETQPDGHVTQSNATPPKTPSPPPISPPPTHHTPLLRLAPKPVSTPLDTNTDTDASSAPERVLPLHIPSRRPLAFVRGITPHPKIESALFREGLGQRAQSLQRKSVIPMRVNLATLKPMTKPRFPTLSNQPRSTARPIGPQNTRAVEGVNEAKESSRRAIEAEWRLKLFQRPSAESIKLCIESNRIMHKQR